MSSSTQAKKTIALFYPAFMGGGAEAVGLWMIEALKEDYDVTLFTVAEVDFDHLNAMYGTQLSPQVVKLKTPFSATWRSLCHFLIANNGDLRGIFFHLLIRYFKQQNQSYDLLISAYNAVDLGRPGIQYIHWVNVVEGNAFQQSISKFSDAQVRENWAIANSKYVAEAVQRNYGIDSTVIYPPVLLSPPQITWEEKENAFICSGRLTPAKEPHKVIQTLQKVREKGFDVKLYLTSGGGGAYDWQYSNYIKKLVKENSDWIMLYENLAYADYVKVMAKCRYGIHVKKEPFGISIAEMVKANLIPFVRTIGGQIEIVGAQNTDLFFERQEDAAEKIINVLGNQELQQQLRASLAQQKSLFSTERFMTEIKQFVDQHFEKTAPATTTA